MSDIPAPRHALGMPAGSVRAILTLIVVAMICAILLLPGEKPIPAYLIHLLYMMVGHYFATRGHSRSQGAGHPLYLPPGCVRLIIIVTLALTIGWRFTNDRAGLEAQLTASVESFRAQPLLPMIVLGGFFAGALVRMVLGRYERSAWFLSFEAWIALISVLLMCVAVLIHLVIDPNLSERLHLPDWEAFLAAVVAFYFGERS